MGLTPMGKAKGDSHHWRAKSDTVLVLLKGLFCLKATGLKLQWVVDYEFPLARLKVLSIPLLQIICCPFAAEKQSRKGQLFIR